MNFLRGTVFEISQFKVAKLSLTVVLPDENSSVMTGFFKFKIIVEFSVISKVARSETSCIFYYTEHTRTRTMRNKRNKQTILRCVR